MELNEKETVVRQELKCLLVQHSLAETGSADDEIVLNYVLGVLECLPPDDDLDDMEDVDPFAETMEAYLPGFSAIHLHDVGEWMISTAMKLSKPPPAVQHRSLLQPVQQSLTQDEGDDDDDNDEDKNSTVLPPSGERRVQIDTQSTHTPPKMTTTQQQQNKKQPQPSPPPPPTTTTRRPPPLSKSSSVDREAGACGEFKRVVQVESVDSNSVGALRELCPAACTVELQHCLHMCGGNVEEAACLLLYRQESGTAITARRSEAAKTRKKNSKMGSDLHNDESVKDSILAKYSFVDTSEDKTEHRPGLFLKEQKKLIRYREGQVVSTKGERFSEIKKQESEELKKTYVNLKPQRKYRFH